MLIASIIVLGLVVVAGMGLAGRYIMLERPPASRWPGAVHGAAGLAGFGLLAASLSLSAPATHAVRMGAGAFGLLAGAVIGGALLAGSAILLAHLRRRAISITLVATHGLLGVVGYTVLATYFTMLR